jgi:hypothetical protein
MKMPKWNDLEQKALQLITSMGKEGILQSELWRKMGATSREGSRISIKLDKKGLIHRLRELSNGRWTYRLFSNREPLTIDAIISCPCLSCEENLRCESEGVISPRTCEMMTNWILTLAEKKD